MPTRIELNEPYCSIEDILEACELVAHSISLDYHHKDLWTASAAVYPKPVDGTIHIKDDTAVSKITVIWRILRSS